MTGSQPVMIGLDVGTTATKAVAFGVDAPFQHTAMREYPLLEPRPGWQVEDPHVVAAAAIDALAACVAGCDGRQVIGICVSAAAHALIGLDSAHRPLTPIVTWADARAETVLGEILATGSAARLHQDTGTPVHPMSPLLKLRWFARYEPGIAEQVHCWLGLKDWILFRLTGSLVTERSSASGSGLLDRWTGQWSRHAAEVGCVDPNRLPTVLPTTTALQLSRKAADRVGLLTRTPVVVGAADGPLANVGAGAIEPGVAGLSLGTSGAVRSIVREQPRELDPSLFCYVLDEESWAIGGAMSNGGVVVRWLGSVLAPDLVADAESADSRVLALAAAVPAGSEGLVMLPYLLAERAPLWDPSLPGAYLGLRRDHRRDHMLRAAVEGVALQLAVIADRLDRLTPIHSIRATGGAFQSPLWGDVLAGALGRDLEVVSAEQGSALGAAALGLRALGHADGLGTARSLLSRGASETVRTVAADPAIVRSFASIRESIPRMIGSLDSVAQLFA
jgi:gluconokinase